MEIQPSTTQVAAIELMEVQLTAINTRRRARIVEEAISFPRAWGISPNGVGFKMRRSSWRMVSIDGRDSCCRLQHAESIRSKGTVLSHSQGDRRFSTAVITWNSFSSSWYGRLLNNI